MTLLGPGLIVAALSGCAPTTSEYEFVPVTGIEFRTELSDVYVNHDTYITGVKVLPENASNKELSWSVLDPSIASISENGIVKGLKAGTTSLVATALDGSKVKKEVSITVKPLEKPASWTLDTAYCFYVEDTFEPNITMYPISQYIDKSVEYEVIEGKDVLKIEDGKVGAYKKGSGKVRVQSKANPDLVGEINCIADGDLLSKYGYKDVYGYGEASVVASLEDRVSLLDFKAPVQKGNWSSVLIELDKTYESKDFIMTLESKLVSGPRWFSVRLALDGAIYSQTDFSSEANGGNPTKDTWTTNTFDYTQFDLEFNQLVLCVNADSDYQNGSLEPYAEMLFDNLTFMEFADNPTSISVKDADVLLPLNGVADIEVEFTPRAVKNRGLTYTVKPGSEGIIAVEDGKLKGLAKGVGYVEVASSVDPSVKTEAKVTVSDELMIALDVVGNDGITVKKMTTYEGREAVTSISANATETDTYPSIAYKLPEKAPASSLSISVDAKMLSGHQWFSITACSDNGTARIQEVGSGDGSRDWKTYTFDFEGATLIDSIRITLNTQKDTAATQKTEVLFNHLVVNVK